MRPLDSIHGTAVDDDITVTEAALLYGCSRTNMSYLVATGRVPSTRNGRIIMVKRGDILALREARDSREASNERIQEVSNG